VAIIQMEQTKFLAIGSKVVEVVSDSFSPIIGVMAGSGMLKALIAVMLMLDWLNPESSTYLTLMSASNAVFYFLPVLLGGAAASRLGANGFAGAAIGASLLEPNFTALIGASDSNFFGIPFVAMNYSYTVFPVFIAVTALAHVEKWIQSKCPENVRLFMVPMVCLMVIVPLTVMVFGPVGVYLGNTLAAGIEHLQSFSTILTGAVLGGGMMFCVIFGLHWGLIPIVIAGAAASGDTIFPMWAASTFAQMGIAFAILIRADNSELRSLAGPATLTGILAGVTEPIIYGLILRFRRTIPIVILSGMIGGAINGYFQVKMTAFAFQSLLTVPVFDSALIYLAGISVSFFMAAGLTCVFGYEANKAEDTGQPVVNAKAY